LIKNQLIEQHKATVKEVKEASEANLMMKVKYNLVEALILNLAYFHLFMIFTETQFKHLIVTVTRFNHSNQIQMTKEELKNHQSGKYLIHMEIKSMYTIKMVTESPNLKMYHYLQATNQDYQCR